MTVPRLAERLMSAVDRVPPYTCVAEVTKVLGLLVEIAGFVKTLAVGSRVTLEPIGRPPVVCEVVGFRDEKALLMAFGSLEGINLGCRAVIGDNNPVAYPDESWLGRVINAFGDPVDGLGQLHQGDLAIPLRNKPPNPHTRQRIGAKLDLGVRSVNSFATICRGQRMGIFAGSGVGKSVLMSMMARYTEADISVIGLVGERGREVQEFLEDDLGVEGLKNAVVIVATGDEPALMRRQAAYMTLCVAEFFRKQGKQVLCMIDSVTRFAMAQREIGLSAGEPPTSRGYPPTTFSELSRLLERGGPGGPGEGSITGIFSVLIEGDDHNEPVADAVRGILDGHIVMERGIADRGRYPAINVLKSVSRSVPKCLTPEEYAAFRKSKEQISIYEDMAELIRLGAYRRGTDKKVDESIRLYPLFEAFLTQNKEEQTTLVDGFKQLTDIVESGGG